MKKYYKVVTIEDKEGQRFYSSACQNSDLVGEHRENAVPYPVGAWAVPHIKGSKLFVFDSVENALSFIDDNCFNKKKIEIWECRVQNPVQMPFLAVINWNKVTTFWDTWRNARKYRHKSVIEFLKEKMCYGRTVAPSGSYGCSKVKLVKCVNSF